MYKYSFRQGSIRSDRLLVDLSPATGNLIKIRSLGYISDRYLNLFNFIDVKVGQDEMYAKFDLYQFPGLEFLKKDFLLLMEVLMDRNHMPYAFIPLNRKLIVDPEYQLKGDQLKDLAESMHNGISENYPFKEMIIPTIVKKFDKNLEPNDILPDLCA